MGFEPVAFGPYELVRRIARGGMAEVFLAIERGMGGIERKVVLKRILPHMSEEPDFVTMFVDEARVTARLTHPNIAHIYNFGEVDGVCFLAMEYVDGLTLSRLRRHSERGRVPLAPALRIVGDVCAGLHAAHDARDSAGRLLGIVHRDVSPQNIMVSRDGVTKLLDFGVARAASQVHATKVGQVKGKLGYIPPEQYRGEPVDRRADLFGVGAVLYEMLTGVRAFVRDNEAATMHAVLLEDPPPVPPELGLPTEVEALVRWAVAKDPAARPRTALAMQTEIERLAAGLGSAVTPFLLGQLVVETMERAAASRVAATGADGPYASTPSGYSGEPALPRPTPEDAGPTAAPDRVDDDAPTTVSEPSRRPAASVDSRPRPGPELGSTTPSLETPWPGRVAPARRSRLPAVAGVAFGLLLLAGLGAAGLWLWHGAGAEDHRRASVVPGSVPGPGSRFPDAAGPRPSGPTVPDRPEPGPTDGDLDAAAAVVDGAARADGGEPGARDAEPATPRPDRRPGRLYLHTTPWSKVRVGRRSLGTTPILGAELPPGAHNLELLDSEGGTHRRVVQIQPGRATKLYLSLTPRPE